MTNPNSKTALRYLQALEAFAAPAVLEGFFDPEIVVYEQPNRLNPTGLRRTREQLLAAAASMGRVISAQRYEVKRVVSTDDTVALEVDWRATLKVPLGATPAGGTLHAALGLFLTFKNGRVVEQRNYDCYDPF